MENQNPTTEPQADEMVTVPKGSTVNVHKYERAEERARSAEARVADLEAQIAALKADGETAKSDLEAFKAKTAEDAKAYAEERARMEAELARKAVEADLLKADCIDPESGIASLKDGETIEQLKERKPHLFKQPTQRSSLAPKDAPRQTAEDELAAKMREAMGLK